MAFPAAFSNSTLLILVAVAMAAASTTDMFAHTNPPMPNVDRTPHENETVFPGHSKAQPATHSWQDILKLKPSGVCRVRFQIKSTGTSVDEQLLFAANNDFDAIILQPEQPTEKESGRRFEVAIIGDARTAIQRLGLASGDFRDQWIEVTGFPRHVDEKWVHGDVAVSQFIVRNIDAIEINSSNWSGSAFR